MLRDCWDYMVYRAEDLLKKTSEGKTRPKKRTYTFQKAAVCIAGILWLITAVRVFGDTNTMADDKRVISAFGNNSYREVSADITTYGKYGNMELTDTAKEIILEKAAEKIGISNYSITNDLQENKKVTTLKQTGKNGDVLCKFITFEKEADGRAVEYEQYVYVGITLKNSVDAAFTYEKIARDIMKEMQIDTDVTVNLKGELYGELDDEQKETLAAQILDKMNAKKQVSRHIDDAYTVYAYDKEIDNFIMVGSDKVNVNVCINYDENKNVTTVYLATPLNTEDF
ncbi:MAG: YwmB family TATA-box binding protein [Lachnospira sp.]|nr:YwmB family TATA-box binding protein [Lachnospira sp.]